MYLEYVPYVLYEVMNPHMTELDVAFLIIPHPESVQITNGVAD